LTSAPLIQTRRGKPTKKQDESCGYPAFLVDFTCHGRFEPDLSIRNQ